MNLGQRIRGALEALSGQTAAAVEANAQADLTFRQKTEAALLAAGETTSQLRTELEALIERINEGQSISADDFAEIKAKVDSLDEAFPDETQSPPAEDPVEDPIDDEGSEPGDEDSDLGDETPSEEPTE